LTSASDLYTSQNDFVLQSNHLIAPFDLYKSEPSAASGRFNANDEKLEGKLKRFK